MGQHLSLRGNQGPTITIYLM